MIDFLPAVNDGIRYHAFIPMLATLYGRDEAPYRFLRVVEKSILSGRSSQKVQSGNYDCIIENVDIETFLTFLCYGYTPYLECALTTFDSGLGISEFQDLFLTQSALRNYESRLQTLLQIADSKKNSIIGSTKMSPETSELCDEIDGALTMWEMIMNLGTGRPTNCISLIKNQHSNEFRIPMKRYKEQFDKLDERLLYNNHHNLPYKISSQKQQILLSAYKCG